MIELVKGLHHFRASDFRSSHQLFQPGGSSRPNGALVIVCNELQIDPFRLISTNLTDLNVIQCLGNIVIPDDGSDSSGSGVELALAVYRPTDIVVCGHAPCRFLEPAPDTMDEEMPILTAMLSHVRRARSLTERHYRDIRDSRERRDVLARENVLVQLEHLRTLPSVSRGLDRGELHLHGWMLRDGEIDAYHVHQEQFVPLAQ